MSTNKKYYWMKLKEDFFDNEAMILMENMQDGFLYSNILIKMYLRGLKSEGRLMVNQKFPYDAQMIATITRHQVGTVEKALKLFISLGLIEVLDNHAIYMSDMQTLIGEGSSEADRKKTYRERIKSEQILIGGGQTSDNRPPEKELDIDLEKEKDIYISEKTEIYLQTFNYFFHKKHRQLKQEPDFGCLEDMDNEEFQETLIEYFEANTIERCNVEYFCTIVDRYL